MTSRKASELSDRKRRRASAGIGLALVAGLLSAATLSTAGCGNTMTNSASQVVLSGPPEGMSIGAPTTVGVRPDVLGASREMPVPANTQSINGAAVSVSGTLHSVSGDWIVVDDAKAGTRHWISLDTVTWIRQPKPESKGGTGGIASESAGEHSDHGHDGPGHDHDGSDHEQAHDTGEDAG